MDEALAWAHRHFWGAKLSDLRLVRRLVEVVAWIRLNPCGTLPQAIQEKACLKAAYRLFSNDSATHEKIVAVHAEHTRAACREPGEYLLIEDTTALSFSHREKIEGLGPLTDEGSQGMLVHTCLAARIERWSPEDVPEVSLSGLFGQECWVREQPVGTRKERKKAKRGQSGPRESDRWGRTVFGTDAPPEDAQWTLVADRECDIFEVMAKCADRGIGWVIRAAQHRKSLPEHQDIFDAVAAAPVLGGYTIDLRARPGVAARTAQVELRALPVSIRPKRESRSSWAPLETGIVEVREVDPPAGAEPVHWVLLTSWACATFAEARRVAAAYATRWLIEEYHKALKTGTHVEDTQLSTADRIKPLLAIHAVVAVALLQMKLLARVHPDAPVDGDTLPPESLAVLETKYGRPPGGWTNQTLICAIARMGGHLGRRGDGPPGWLSIWRGWKQLVLMTEGYILAMQHESCG